MARLTKPLNMQIDLPKQVPAHQSGGGFPLYGDVVENFAWISDVFSNEELDAIISIGTQLEMDQARTGGATYGKQNLEMRNSSTSWFFPNEVTDWVFRRLSGAVNSMNAQFFGFELTSMEQGLQFTRYAAPGQHYDWHIDRGASHGCRKLSLSLQLSDPADYEGGELELWFGGGEDEIIKAQKQRGMMTFFPSWTMHRVAPVTAGVRHSLVCWVSGPSFK
jgi:PKHD-type hydroxylase